MGELMVACGIDGVGTLRGYENHAGLTELRTGDPLGRRIDADGHDLGPEGAVVGPAFIRTPRLHDARYEEILRDSGALERELSALRRAIMLTYCENSTDRSMHRCTLLPTGWRKA